MSVSTETSSVWLCAALDKSRYREYWFSTTDLVKMIAEQGQTCLTGAKKQYSG
jgi:hypothetical protein